MPARRVGERVGCQIARASKREECESTRRGESRRPVAPALLFPVFSSPILEYDAMRWYYVAIFYAIILKRERIGGVGKGAWGRFRMRTLKLDLIHPAKS